MNSLLSFLAFAAFAALSVNGIPRYRKISPYYNSYPKFSPNSLNSIDEPKATEYEEERNESTRIISGKLGSRVTLECSFKGNKWSIITWDPYYKPKMDIFAEIKHQLHLEGHQSDGLAELTSKYVFDCLKPNDEGPKRCAIFNETRNDSPKEFHVEVQGTEYFSCGEKKKPIITEHTKTLMLEQGKTAILRCEAQGKPEPEITWKFSNGSIVTDVSPRFEIYKGYLIIRNIVWGDMGAYICVAENEFDRDVQDSFLYPILQSEKFVARSDISNGLN